LRTKWSVIGLMSGTSLDGLDLAFCQFDYEDAKGWSFKIVAAECYPYSQSWKQKLNDAHLLSGLDLLLLDQEYGQYIGEIIVSFKDKFNADPDFIASHGHTVFHRPDKRLSFQMGSGASIYAKTGIPVVCDFRSVDVNLGGQGAPLVPAGDAILFKEYDYCMNLGGIANISFDKEGIRLAYDICGCNLLLNALANEIGLEYDESGKIAETGVINNELLDMLDQWDYYQKSAPKSLDKETMLSELLPLIQDFPVSIADKLATVSEHITFQISKAIEKDAGSVLITGGGALNKTLVSKIKKKTILKVIVPDEELIHFKEALIFAFLGVLRVLNQNNTYASVTGASHDSIGGAIYGGNFNS